MFVGIDPGAKAITCAVLAADAAAVRVFDGVDAESAGACRSDALHWPHRDAVDSSNRRNAWSSTGRRVVVRKGRWERPSRAFCAGGC